MKEIIIEVPDTFGQILNPKTVKGIIVRCKDCINSVMTEDNMLCKYCKVDTDDDGYPREVYHDADWFCADGEMLVTGDETGCVT